MGSDTFLIHHRDGGYLRREPNAKFTRVTRIEWATPLSKEKANNVIKNSISADQRHLWCLVPAPLSVTTNPEKPATTQTTGAAGKTQTPTETTAPAFFNWDAILQGQQSLYSNLTGYGNSLRNQLSRVDQEISDIQHYIELTSLDTAEGYRAYEMLKERLTHRRNIKNEMLKLNCFLGSSPSDFTSGQTSQQFLAIDTQQRYTPRVLAQLF